jgi:hypothetical protein
MQLRTRRSSRGPHVNCVRMTLAWIFLMDIGLVKIHRSSPDFGQNKGGFL